MHRSSSLTVNPSLQLSAGGVLSGADGSSLGPRCPPHPMSNAEPRRNTAFHFDILKLLRRRERLCQHVTPTAILCDAWCRSLLQVKSGGRTETDTLFQVLRPACSDGSAYAPFWETICFRGTRLCFCLKKKQKGGHWPRTVNRPTSCHCLSGDAPVPKLHAVIPEF